MQREDYMLAWDAVHPEFREAEVCFRMQRIADRLDRLCDELDKEDAFNRITAIL